MATILVIDDEHGVREFIRRTLEGAGYQVTEADNGERGLACFRESPADLVITDILMPRKEGIETIREWRGLSPNVKIVGIPGGGDTGFMDFLQAAQAMGANDVLHKPFRGKDLLERVETLLGRAPLSQTESSR